MRKNKKHSLEFKLSIVDRIVQGQSSAKTIAKVHSLSHYMVRRWQKQFESFYPQIMKVFNNLFSYKIKCKHLNFIGHVLALDFRQYDNLES